VAQVERYLSHGLPEPLALHAPPRADSGPKAV
jgi:hypothetical protein